MIKIEFKKNKLGIKYFTQGLVHYILNCSNYSCFECELWNWGNNNCDQIAKSKALELDHSGVLLTAYIKQLRF